MANTTLIISVATAVGFLTLIISIVIFVWRKMRNRETVLNLHTIVEEQSRLSKLSTNILQNRTNQTNNNISNTQNGRHSLLPNDSAQSHKNTADIINFLNRAYTTTSTETIIEELPTTEKSTSDKNNSCTVSINISHEFILANILNHNQQQQSKSSFTNDTEHTNIVIITNNHLLTKIEQIEHKIPTTAENSPISENVSISLENVLSTFSKNKHSSEENKLGLSIAMDDRISYKLSPSGSAVKLGHEKLSTIILTQYSTDSEVLLVAPAPNTKNTVFLVHPRNEQSFDMDGDFTNTNDPKYFVDSDTGVHGFTSSVEIHNDRDLMINTFGLPIERLPKEMRCASSASVDSLDADFILEPAYFENMCMYDNNTIRNIGRCSMDSNQTIVILDTIANRTISSSTPNINQSPQSMIMHSRPISTEHGFSNSMHMHLNESLQWTKPGLPIDHVTFNTKSMDLLTTVFSTKDKSISFGNNSGSIPSDNISTDSMTAEQFILWQIQGRRLRKMTHKQLIEWLQKSNFDQSVINRFTQLRIDGNKLWHNIRNASMFLYNVGVIRPTLRDAIVQNIYLNLLPKTPGFDERHIADFKNLKLIANGPISTVYKAMIKRRNLGLRQSTVVIKGYHFTADNVRVGKIIQILVHLVNNITSDLFVKIHGFIRNMQDYESHLTAYGSNESYEESDSESEEEKSYKIKHKNGVAQVKAESAMFGIVIEYVNEGSIRSLYDMKNGMKRFNSMDKIGILIDIASAICYSLHDKGYLHRNLKASNVLIKSDESVKLTDYCMDVTQITDVSFGKQQSERSLRWMAPELLINSTNIEYSKKSDVYSFGITMYEILSGHHPYHKHKHPELLITQILNGLRPNMDDIVLYPQPLLHLMNQCWSETIDERPDFLYIVETLVDIRDNERNTKKTFDDYVNAFERMRNSKIVKSKAYMSSPLLLSSDDLYSNDDRIRSPTRASVEFDDNSMIDKQIMSLFCDKQMNNKLRVNHLMSRHARDDSALELELKPKLFKPGKRRPRKPLPSAPPKKALPSIHTRELVINNTRVVIPDKPLPQPAIY